MNNDNLQSIFEKEKELLTLGAVDFYLSEIEYDEKDMQGGDGYDIVDNDPIKLEQDNELEEYKWIYKTFGKNIFVLNEENRNIKLHEDFKAKNEYLLCLCAMNRNVLNEKISKKISNGFERIAAETVKRYLGENAQAILIDDNQKKINIKTIFEKKLKEKYNQDIATNFNKHNHRADIIAWKEIDNRIGKIILIVQCKSGKRWREGPPVNIKSWTENIGNFSVQPIHVFFVSDLICNDDDMLKYGKEKGLIFDRVRVVRLLARADNDKLKKIREDINTMKLEEYL